MLLRRPQKLKKRTPKTRRSWKDAAEKLRHQQDPPHAVASRSKSKNHRHQNNKTPQKNKKHTTHQASKETPPLRRQPKTPSTRRQDLPPRRHGRQTAATYQKQATPHLRLCNRLTTPTKLQRKPKPFKHILAEKDRKRKTLHRKVVQDVTQKLKKLIPTPKIFIDDITQKETQPQDN